MLEDTKRLKRLAATQAWRAANPDKVKLANKKRREADPIKAAADTLNWRKVNPEHQKRLTVRWRKANSAHYKTIKCELSKAWALRKQVAQAGRPRPELCEICDLPGKICFDHCHVTGKFRGWICHKCNLALGHAADNPDTLMKLAKYLKKR